MTFNHSYRLRPAGRTGSFSNAFVPRSTALAVALRGALVTLAIGAAAQPQPARAQAATTTLPAGDAIKTFDVPAGPLDAVLDRFARTAGVNLSYDSALISGLTSKGLTGSHSVASAISLLLAGTGIEAVAQAGGGYSLRKAPAAASASSEMGANAAATLPAVMIAANSEPAGDLPKPYAGGQVARGSSVGILGNTDYMDTPFSTSSVTDQFVRNEQVKELSDVFRYDASAQRIGGLSTPGIVFRGFSLATTETGINGHYGLGNFNGYTDVQAFERIEVVRGPTAMLQGYVGGSTGASVNMAAKRASDEPLTMLTAFYETGSNAGAALDVGRRFGADGKWGVRANGMLRDGSIEGEEQDHKNTLGSLALDFRGERLRASLDYILHVQEGRGPYGCDAYDLNQEPNQSKCFLNTNEHMDVRNEILIAALDYDITDRLRVSLSHGRNWADAYFGATFASDQTPPSGGLQPLMVQAFPLYRRPQSTQADLHWIFDTGPIAHELTLGASYYKSKSYIFYDAYEIGVSIPEGTIPPDLAPSDPGAPYTEGEKFTGYALVDRMSFQDGRYQLIAGLRRQNVVMQAVGQEDYDESATTPSVALLYRPVEQWMFYGSYIEGLKPGPRAPLEGPLPGTTYVNGGEMFAPTRNKQYEAGVKWDSGILGATLGVFQMTELNEIAVATADPSEYLFAVNGERRHRGIELNVFGEPTRGVRLLGGLTLLDAKLTQTEGGLRDGEEVIGVPRQKFVLSGEYDVPGLTGLTLTAAATAVGDANRDIGEPALGDTLPGYAIFDAGARYRTSIAAHATTLRLNVRNLSDREYFAAAYPVDGYLTFGQPRTVFLSAEIEL